MYRASIKESPGGSIFPYPYKDGELFGLHFGSFGADEDGLIARMETEEAFFLQQNHRIGLWMDFYQTQLTERGIAALIAFLQHTGALISRLALVGCSRPIRWKINRRLRKAGGLHMMPVRYFRDPEEAKTWLVSEIA